MAFVNEKLTDEQRDEFEARRISFLGVEKARKPIYWTIDTDKNLLLISAGGNRDFPNVTRFIFIWYDTPVYFYLQWKYKNDILIWSEPQFSASGFYTNSKTPFNPSKEFFSDLRDALQVYKSNGHPDAANQNINVEIEV